MEFGILWVAVDIALFCHQVVFPLTVCVCLGQLTLSKLSYHLWGRFMEPGQFCSKSDWLWNKVLTSIEVLCITVTVWWYVSFQIRLALFRDDLFAHNKVSRFICRYSIIIFFIIIIKLSFVARLNKKNLARKRVTEESKVIINKYCLCSLLS